MAHMITKTDRLVLTGKPAWHGLGTVVADAPNVWEAMKVANLGWEVKLFPVFAQADDACIRVPNRFATVRSDTMDVLGTVSHNYRVCQNVQIAKLIDELADANACPRIESAGSLRGGRDVFFLVRLGSFFADSKRKDEVERYMCFLNSHDGLGMLGMLPTTIRVVCKNTQQAALSLGKAVFTEIRHVPNFQAQFESAAKNVINVMRTHESYEAAVQALAAKKFDKTKTEEFFKEVFMAIEGNRAVREDTDKVRARAVKQMEAWLNNMDVDDNSVSTTRGTAWHALNAVTYWADHQRPGTVDATWSKLAGPGHDIKAKALKVALTTIG